MPCIPSAAIRLIAHSISCWLPQSELVVPKRMSGLTGSSERWDTVSHAVDDEDARGAAVTAPSASAQDMNSRLLRPRPFILSDMAASYRDGHSPTAGRQPSTSMVICRVIETPGMLPPVDV